MDGACVVPFWAKKMLYNVLVVYDGFLFAIKGKRSFPRKQKTVGGGLR